MPDRDIYRDPMHTYNRLADTVGGVPNLRLKDNIFQLMAVTITSLAGGVGGLILQGADNDAWGMPGWAGPALGGGLGFIAGGVLSGFVLMVLGWIRAAKGK